MKLDLNKFNKIILFQMFNNNQRKCAIAMEITPEFLNKILKGNSLPGAKFFGKLKKFCNKNKLNFDQFIFLD